MFKCDESSASSGLSFRGKPPVLSNSYNIYVRFATNLYHPINYYGNWLCLPISWDWNKLLRLLQMLPESEKNQKTTTNQSTKFQQIQQMFGNFTNQVCPLVYRFFFLKSVYWKTQMKQILFFLLTFIIMSALLMSAQNIFRSQFRALQLTDQKFHFISKIINLDIT